MKQKTLFVILFFFLLSGLSAQPFTPAQYINTYRDIAVSEMRRSGIPAAITLAQGILESECGNSDLSRNSNNHFGIKCKTNWTGERVYHDDDANGECFRKYPTVEQSYKDHSDFLRAGKHYAFLFDLDPHDYKAWCYGLKKAGYATNPRYPEMLIKSIEKYELQQYTLLGMATDADSSQLASKEKKEPKPLYLDPPPGKFFEKSRHNDIKAVYVPKGTSLLAIARNYRIPLGHFLGFNDLEEDGLTTKDQWLYLHKKMKHGKKEKEIALAGETMYDIAQRTAVMLENLIKYNPGRRKTDMLTEGTVIYLTDRKRENGQGKVVSPNFTSHIVQPGETLGSIAKKYKVAKQEIKKWNNLHSEKIKPGQKLFIQKIN